MEGEKLLANNFLPEICDRFKIYTELLLFWNQKINLVSRSDASKSAIAEHILDSALLDKYIELRELKDNVIIDIGSGAGFPGLILAILGHKNCFLIEKNYKKAAFLLEAISVLGLSTNVINDDVRNVKNIKADIIVSRALCGAHELIEYSIALTKEKSRCLLHKGTNWQQDIDVLLKDWYCDFRSYNNIYKPNSVIVSISDLNRR